jgi:hypothetical protein
MDSLTPRFLRLSEIGRGYRIRWSIGIVKPVPGAASSSAAVCSRGLLAWSSVWGWRCQVCSVKAVSIDLCGSAVHEGKARGKHVLRARGMLPHHVIRQAARLGDGRRGSAWIRGEVRRIGLCNLDVPRSHLSP